MAGAGKRRAKAEDPSSSGEPSAERQSPPSGQQVQESAEQSSAPRSTPQSLPRFDGNRDPQEAATLSVDIRGQGDLMGIAGYYAARGLDIPADMPKRPAKLNTQGREVVIGLNTFNVVAIPSKPIYQYDVIIGSGSEKRGLIKAVWNSKTLQNQLGQNWIFDGNKIAWSLDKKGQKTINIDLDVERGRQVRPDRRGRNSHRVVIRETKTVNFTLLNSYLARQADHTNEVTEALIFLDHLMRETPTRKFTQIKKSFFARGQTRVDLGFGIEAFKGVFSSMRIVNGPANKPGLSVNVDVANGTFWAADKLHKAVINILGLQPNIFLNQFRLILQKGNWDKSPMKANLKRLSKLGIKVKHRGIDKETGRHPEYIIEKVIPRTAEEYKIELLDRDDAGNITKRTWSTIAEYFLVKHEIPLMKGLPLVKMTKKDIILPMEVCEILQNQRYPFKLNEKQTAAMIRFAVTPPSDRMESIKHGLGMLDWKSDTVLQMYGLKIDPALVKVKARQLQPPTVQFAGNGPHVQPGESGRGRWQLIGKKFVGKNTAPLKSWGFCIIPASRGGPNDADLNTTRRFAAKFAEVYARHGGQVLTKDPIALFYNVQRDEMLQEAWNKVGNTYQQRPQIIFFVVPDRNSETYNKIKKGCECRYGVVSQFVQMAHVVKCQDQYISNVCMKVNAKLGGFTSRAVGNLLKIAPQSAKIPTMCIGADVSHPSPGSPKDGSIGSFAAITMSLDTTLTRYAAQCETNGFRVEMITTANITNLLGKMVTHWSSTIGRGQLPDRVLFFRDGVSEAQYQHVIEQEVRDIKALFKSISPKSNTKFVVVVASKRHHVRFFPDRNAGDRNGNPNPGTLVETGVTHPFQFDFYLNAHSAIKGTARPVHYTVILNEAGMPPDELQQMIFEHSFQYIRSTTPVSIFPAVYYAHLASQRARGHANPPEASSGKKQTEEKKDTATSISEKTPTEVQPLAPMNPSLGIDFAMWYI
ncbi:uncharacterized protein K452DRAFT_266507 [Aplosporella prunicola CBS 121167]|uniref:Piwi domain-containing protein n=1 Tax=Aplosporella prunicola CBS 121167 TaxID=1176127 RepID=A0A6A6BNZ1_9PEZI|nr:uncharacterized protein K452DRAFT_266507 [Aplosporella prunicola CBS 121167]KAF2144567.1 hypothetical protein K452DRAFT_266507 [Aplosporella prunicola CBS 121167]